MTSFQIPRYFRNRQAIMFSQPISPLIRHISVTGYMSCCHYMDVHHSHLTCLEVVSENTLP